MTLQRKGKNAQPVTIRPSARVQDGRGNWTYILDEDVDAIETTGAFIPQRSARAEVPGQMEIDVTRLIVEADLEGVNLWSRVYWKGEEWDIVSPPAYHHGTRHTRHWSIDIRKRP